MTGLKAIVAQVSGLSPVWRIVAGVACGALALGAVFFAAHALGFRFDPFNLAGKRADKAEAAATVATDNAEARSLEAKGEAATTQRVEVVVRQARAAEALTATLTETAKAAPDAKTPLDPDRLARLRSHDDSLCAIAALDGCPAAADDAPDGKGRMQALPAP